MDERKAITLEQLEIVKGYIDDKDALNIKSAEFVDSTVKLYTSDDKSGEPAIELVLPEEMFLDGSKTEFVNNFVWSAEKYPKSTNPDFDGKPVLVLAVKSVRTIRYSFISLESVVVELAGGETNSTSVTIADDVISLDVKVSEEPDNRVIVKDDGLYVGAVDTTPQWTVSTDEEVSDLFSLDDTPSYGEGTLGAKNVGDIVQIMENGFPANFIIVQKGLPSDAYDESCNGIWVLRESIYEKKEWNNWSTEASNDYCLSTINAYLNTDYYNKIDSVLRGKIMQASIPIGLHWGHPVQDKTVLRHVFLLSGYEVGAEKGSSTWMTTEGSKLAYFVEGWDNNDAKRKRVCYDGTKIPTTWWVRSQYRGNGSLAYYCKTDGTLDSAAVNQMSHGIRPSFILPYNITVDSDGLVTG